jgi:trk system potassium uptake protein TrkA
MKKNNSVESTSILILGLGGMGYYLARRLVHEGYLVTAIESDSRIIKHANENLDARVISGNAMSIDCWKEASAEKSDYLIAVTNNDAVNMVACLIGEKLNIPNKIARIRSMDFGGDGCILSDRDLKVDLIIHPEELAAQEFSRLIKLRSGNDIVDVANEEIEIMAIRINEKSPLANRSLKDIAREYNEFRFRVVAIARGITTLIPGGEDQLLPQDLAFLMVCRQNLKRLMEITGVGQQKRNRVMIMGGSLVGRRLAELLGKSVKVTLIEKDDHLAEELSFALPHAEVLHGDGSESEVLTSAGLLEMDTFITATSQNETNIMTCVLAKHLMDSQNGEGGRNKGKCISLVNKEEYLVLAGTMGSDIALNMHILAGNEILKFIRRGELLSVAHLHALDADVVEIVAAPGSPITRRPLSELSPFYYGKVMIGGIHRDGSWRVAVGDTQIVENERVIAVCLSPHLKEVQKLFLA